MRPLQKASQSCLLYLEGTKMFTIRDRDHDFILRVLVEKTATGDRGTRRYRNACATRHSILRTNRNSAS